jgi:S-adenosylmethionine decarboxylase proenzyme
LNALGRHLLLELKDCNRDLLNNMQFLRECLVDTAEKIGATVVSEAFHHFSPQGISGVVVIAESHLCIHTWPEYGFAAIDIFTCGHTIDPTKAIKIFVEKFEARDFSYTELKRGILQENGIAVG